MNPRRVARLQQQIKQRIAEVLLRDLQDPRIGLVTITRVELDRECTQCKVYWSVLSEKDRGSSASTLERARSFIQREVEKTLHTRTAPRLEFHFDESIAGAIRIQEILHELREERERRGGSTSAPEPDAPAGSAPPDAPPR
jgi:ribosome-binding factor A